MFSIVLIVICTLLLLLKFTRKSDYWIKRNVLEINNLVWKFAFERRSMAEVCKNVYDMHNVNHIGTHMGRVPTLIIKNVVDIQAVLASNFQCFYSRGIDVNKNDILADNLWFMSDYKKWKLLRLKLSPVFTSSKLKNMFYIIEKCAGDFVDLIENKPCSTQNPFKLLFNYTTSSIDPSVFGIDTKTKNTMESPFLEMAWTLVEPSTYTNIVVFISAMFPKLFKFLNLKLFKKHEGFFLSTMKSILEQRRGITGGHDFIEICIELQKYGIMRDTITGFELPASDEVLAAQAFAFFIAGADTTANTLHFTLIELSNNPKILKKLHEEIDVIFQGDVEELTYIDINKLHYLDMVISEAVRKYPPIALIQRLCTKDTVLPTGVEIREGESVAIPVYALHRDERYYPNPDMFEPERFSSENVSKIMKFAYLPFGEGNRICLGARLARLQLKTGLAWLLRRFTLAEQHYTPTFDQSPFALRDSKARYEFIERNIL